MTIKKLILPALSSMLLFSTQALFAQSGGEAIFKKQCAMCHGPDGSGQTGMGKAFKLRDLRSADVQKMSDAQFEETISKGKGKMPAYGTSLGAEKIKSVVAYLRELGKNKK